MTKRELSAILARASKEELGEIAGQIKKECEISVIKQPQKTLVMVKARESIFKSLFYLGEVLATECMVMVDKVKGASVIAGDEFDKAVSAAIIDGFLNGTPKEGQNDGKKESADQVLMQIEKLGKAQEKQRESRNRQLRKSKVNFNVMGE